MWQKLPRDLKILLYSTILANTSGRMIDPMPLYILALGGTVAQVGIFFTVNTLAAALMRPVGGWFSDAIGRVQAVVYLLVNIFGSRLADRWTPASALAASGFLQATALLLLALYPTPSMFWIFFALSAASIGIGDPAFDAFLARSTSKETLGLTFGLFSTAISIFSAPAPYLGSLLWAGVAQRPRLQPEHFYGCGRVIDLVYPQPFCTKIIGRILGRWRGGH